MIAATAARLGALAAAAEGGICPICCVDVVSGAAGNTAPIAAGVELRVVDGDTDSFTPRVRSDKRSVTLLLGTTRFYSHSNVPKKQK